MTTTLGSYMHWTSVIREPLEVKSYYLLLPELVELHSLQYAPEPRVLVASIDLSHIPNRPPLRWDPAANRAQVLLEFLEVQDLAIERFGLSGQIKQSPFEPAGELMRFRLEGPTLFISGACRALGLLRLTGYVSEER